MSLDKKIRSRSAGFRIRKPNTLETLDSFVISEGGEGIEKKFTTLQKEELAIQVGNLVKLNRAVSIVFAHQLVSLGFGIRSP